MSAATRWRLPFATLAAVAAALGVAAAQPPQDRADDYRDVMLAQLALEEGDFAAAAVRFESLASRDPDSADWVNAAVGARLASGDPEAALRMAQAGAASGVEMGPQARLALGAEALRLRQWDEVRAWLDDVEGDPNERLAAGLLLAWALVGEGETEAGVAELLALPAPRAIASSLPFQRAMMFEHDRDWRAAERAYGEAAAGSRVFVENILRYGAFLQRRDRDEEAAIVYARWRVRATNVALIAAEEGRFQAASPTVARSASLGLAGFGSGLADERALSAAATMMSLALLLDPDQHGVRIALGGRLREAGQASAAIAVLAPIGPTSVYYEVAQVEVIWLTAEAGRPDEALALAQALSAETGGRFAMRALADISLQQQDWAGAEAAYTGLIAMAEMDGTPQWRPLYRRAIARDRQGRWAEAEADLLAALAIAPNEADVLNHLGYGWVSRGIRLEEGLALIQRALRAAPNAAHIQDSEGWALFQLGRYDEAIAALERAQRRDPASPVIAEHLGDALWRAGRRREARFQWRRAAGLTEDSAARAAIEAKIGAGLPEPS